MYKVKNLDALELAETLSTVFEEEDDPLTPPNIGRSDTLNIVDTLAAEASQAAPAETGQVPLTTGGTSANGAVSANLTVKIVADEATNSLLIRSTARDYRQLLILLLI